MRSPFETESNPLLKNLLEGPRTFPKSLGLADPLALLQEGHERPRERGLGQMAEFVQKCIVEGRVRVVELTHQGSLEVRFLGVILFSISPVTSITPLFRKLKGRRYDKRDNSQKSTCPHHQRRILNMLYHPPSQQSRNQNKKLQFPIFPESFYMRPLYSFVLKPFIVPHYHERGNKHGTAGYLKYPPSRDQQNALLQGRG